MTAFKDSAEFLCDLRHASKYYQVPYLKALARSARLYSLGQFSRKEILGYGLFNPEIAARFPVLISKERSLAKLSEINPPHLHYLTEDKDEFYRICREHSLPIPSTYAWTKQGIRYDAEGNPIESNAAWEDYLSSKLPQDFIIKDRAGTYGSGFHAFRRIGDSFQEAESGSICNLRGLIQLFSAKDESGLIIQERLFDAEPLRILSGRRGLQTMRVNTLRQEDGGVSILFYMIKLLAGRTLSDNFSMGTTGNLIAFGDLEDGVLRAAVNIHQCGSGMKEVAVHPETKIALKGFHIPFWSEAIQLAKAGQCCVTQLPTLGWDIAITDEGPVIIEANARWDPPLYAPFIMTNEHWQRIFA